MLAGSPYILIMHRNYNYNYVKRWCKLNLCCPSSRERVSLQARQCSIAQHGLTSRVTNRPLVHFRDCQSIPKSIFSVKFSSEGRVLKLAVTNTVGLFVTLLSFYFTNQGTFFFYSSPDSSHTFFFLFTWCTLLDERLSLVVSPACRQTKGYLDRLSCEEAIDKFTIKNRH